MDRRESGVMEAARVKLARIIAREGDLGGLRLTPEYLAQLAREEEARREFTDYAEANRRAANVHRVSSVSV